MREGVGFQNLLTYIIIFIVIAFAFLSGTLSYMKGFKVNSKIIGILEKYEGYNSYSEKAIENALDVIGYVKGSANCKNIEGYTLKNNNNYSICIYEPNNIKTDSYFKYKIITYIYMDIPIIGQRMKIPVKSYSERIYYFKK